MREFLPPDPLGGLQSGYARQLSLKDAFYVFLGGVLVGSLKFTIPEARRILNDITPWLKATGLFSFSPALMYALPHKNSFHYHLGIMILNHEQFVYSLSIKPLKLVPGDELICLQKDADQLLPVAEGVDSPQKILQAYRVLNVSALYIEFLEKLKSS
ncbi:MAG: hypothetical protein GY874_00585 [Desulfobacteraceae bacterium]|nr:hypothetical protein [Desulfobacteraceae bacterium]